VPLALYLGAHATSAAGLAAGVWPYLWTIPAFILATNLVFIARIWEIRHASYGPR
jgi:hypothetical protein